MNVLEKIKRIPNVKVENVEDILQEPTNFVKRNVELSKDTYQTIAYYDIYKGNDKGKRIELYIGACFDGSSEQYVPYFGVKSANADYSYDSLDEAVKCFKSKSFEHELKSVYRVYQAKLKAEDETIQFCVSAVREVSFIEDVKNGLYSIDLDTLTLIKETEDRNEARAMATEF